MVVLKNVKYAQKDISVREEYWVGSVSAIKAMYVLLATTIISQVKQIKVSVL